jgi:hypothetical protein
MTLIRSFFSASLIITARSRYFINVLQLDLKYPHITGQPESYRRRSVATSNLSVHATIITDKYRDTPFFIVDFFGEFSD